MSAGPRKLTKRQERMLLVLDCLDNGINDICDIAARTGLRETSVVPLVSEILSSRMDAISSRDIDLLIKKSASSYQMMVTECVKLLTLAKTGDEKREALDSWRKVQEAEDRLFSLSGIYVKKERREITSEDVQSSPEWKQMSGLFEEFLYTVGIDFKKFVNFVRDRSLGRVGAVDTSGADNDPLIDPATGKHVKARKRDGALGAKNKSLNLHKYVPGFEDVNVLKSKYILGGMTSEDEDAYFEKLSTDEQMEYLRWKGEQVEQVEQSEVQDQDPDKKKEGD